MMNNNMMKRLKKAAGYQKQAILALLPEGMEGHLDVIEKEIKDMLTEAVAKVVSECKEDLCKADDSADKSDSNVKKVTID